MTVLTDFLNRTTGIVLSSDRDTRERLAGLEGKILCLRISAPEMQLYLKPGDSGIEVLDQFDGDADVILSGSSFAFLRLATSGIEGSLKSPGGVKVEGDVETGQAFQRILAQSDFDLEEIIARYTGDTPARKIGNLARSFGKWAEESADLSRENLADYFREETRTLVSAVAMQRFEADVDRLRSDVDRLDQRITRLALKQDAE